MTVPFVICFKIGSIEGNLSKEKLLLTISVFSPYDLFDLSEIGGMSPLLSVKNRADLKPLLPVSLSLSLAIF